MYSLGHEHYELYMKNFVIILFSSTFGLYLFLTLTQKCRIVALYHDKEVADYLQRKKLYSEFESEELFKRQ